MTAPRAGVIVAPAGYGKTSRLIEGMANELRCLALTHTNVAVANIKRRRGTQPLSRVETIDSLARRLATAFPSISGTSEDAFDWPLIRAGATRALQRPAIRDAFARSYDQLLVDEYQDCSSGQVNLIKSIAAWMPTLVLGDPLQSLYDPIEKGTKMSWEEKIQGWDTLETLDHPWRWEDNPQHQEWVVDARAAILSGGRVSLPGGTAAHLRIQDDRGSFLSDLIKSRPGRWAIIMGDSKRPQLLVDTAKRHRWISMEVAELSHPPELDRFAQSWDAGNEALAILEMAKTCISSCGKLTSFDTCMKNAKLGRPTRSNSSLAGKVADLQLQRTPAAALSLLRAIETDPATGTYRPGLLSLCKRSLRALRDVPEEGMADAIKAVQTQERAGVERPRSGPVVGSVLRLKGLEFDHVAIVDPECFSTPEEVYVAVSRARASCTVVTTADHQMRWFSSPHGTA